MASKTPTHPPPPKSSSRRGPRRKNPKKKETDPEKRQITTRQQLSAALGDTARAGRLLIGITQADVAENIGVATEVYGRLERGLLLPSVPTLRRLCLALRVSADKLLSLDCDHPPGWTQVAPLPERESPHIRRLLRHARKLTIPQLRALSLVAVTLHRGA